MARTGTEGLICQANGQRGPLACATLVAQLIRKMRSGGSAGAGVRRWAGRVRLTVYSRGSLVLESEAQREKDARASAAE